MKNRKIFNSRELQILPIGFQFFNLGKKTILQKNIELPKIINIRLYNTDIFSTFSHYKSISKILKPK